MLTVGYLHINDIARVFQNNVKLRTADQEEGVLHTWSRISASFAMAEFVGYILEPEYTDEELQQMEQANNAEVKVMMMNQK